MAKGWLRAVLAVAWLPPLLGTCAFAAQRYVVQPGDTLNAVARRFDTTVSALEAANRLTGGLLRVGQILQVPDGQEGGYRTAVVRQGETLAGVTARQRLRRMQDNSLRAAIAHLPEVSFSAHTFVAPVQGRVSSRFGWRSLSVNGNHFHAGVDLAAPMGTPVHAARDGTVVKAGWGGTYGNVVYLDHGDGTQTRYAHLSRIDVHVGQGVRQGDLLGLVGSTGASTGPHLHFELRFDGRAVDPLAYLQGLARR